MICIDSDIFLIELRYPRDRRSRQNRAILDSVARSGNGATTVFNLLEVAGILSFNLNELQLLDFYVHFPRRYKVQILPYQDPRQRARLAFDRSHACHAEKAAFGDALIAALVNRLRSELEAFTTWNDQHFQGRVMVPVLTPTTFGAV